MKAQLHSTLFLFLFLGLVNPVLSQDYPNEKYPHVTEDLIDDYPFWIYINHKLTLGGAWGLGASIQYNKPWQPHVHAEAGYSFVLAMRDKKTTDFKPKAFRPWFDLAAGYPVLSFTRSVKGKYTTDVSVSGNIRTENFYKIKVPTTTLLIPQVGVRLNPYSIKIYNRETSQSHPYSYLLPTLNIGLKILSISSSNIKIVDRKSHKKTVASTKRMGEIYAGLVFPMRKELKAPHENYNGVLATGMGYEFMFKIPSRHNGIGTFEIGIRYLGYDIKGFSTNKVPSKKQYAQFVFSNSFYIH